jgi:pimeloyl-ACP methyl ester carboxylesterase
MWHALPLAELPIKSIIIDLPGHGQSELPASNPSIKSMAQEVEKVLQLLEVNQFTIVGHSMGAYVGLELSKRRGFQKLILLNSNCWSDSEQKKQDRLRVAQLVQNAKSHFIREAMPNLFAKPQLHPFIIEGLMEEANHMTPEAIAYAALAMRERTDFTAYVNDHPELFIFVHGKLDRLVSVADIQSKISGPQIHLLDCGHMAHVEAGAEVMDIFAQEVYK